MSSGGFPNGVGRVNSYALVYYASGQLAEFLDALRAELEPEHPAPRSHVTVLPPRPIADPDAALLQLQNQASEFSPFRAVLGGVHSFEGSNVVYLSVAHGFDELSRMHRRLNQHALQYQEPYPYHPHITLAQGLSPERLPEVLERARQRWESYTGPRFFPCRSWFFVQATAEARWVDLAEIEIPSVVASRTD